MRIQALVAAILCSSTLVTAATAPVVTSEPHVPANFATIEHLLEMSGFKHKGGPERNVEAYQTLAKLRAMIPTRTKKHFVQARPKRMTNAERLARRLPPNPPVRRKPGGNARRQEPSPGPPASSDGIFQVTDENGDGLGYISTVPDESGGFTITPDAGDAIQLSATYDSLVTNPAQLRVTVNNPSNPDFPILGLLQGRDNVGTDIGPGSYNYLYVTTVGGGGTPQNSLGELLPNTYSDVTGIDLIAQTNVWTLETATGRLIPQWVNADGSVVTGQLFMQNGGIYVLGDPAAFQAEFPEPIEPIDLYLSSVIP